MRLDELSDEFSQASGPSFESSENDTIFTTARGRQRLSPRLRLSPTTTVTVLATTDLVTGSVTATVMDFTTERGKPRLSPRLRLSPGWLVVTTVDSTTDLVTGPTVMAMDSTTERGK